MRNAKQGTKLRWNFAMGLLHGIFFNGGMAFSNPTTILPVFLNTFTHSKTIVGLFSSVMNTGSVLPQFFVASKLETKVNKKPVLVIAITARALCWGLLGLITYLFGRSHPLIIVISLFFLLTLFSFMGGIASVPFMDIWGKAIPSTLRGRFFGHRQLWGGLLAISAGFMVKHILGNKNLSFPDNYGFLFLLSFVFISISYLALGSVKEPIEEVHRNRLTFRDFLKKAFGTLKLDRNYRVFLIIQILIGVNGLVLPFYVLYAKDVIGVQEEMIGMFISAQMLGSTLSNILWAYLSDYVGNKRVIQTSAFISLLIPIVALLITKQLWILFIFLFLLIGFSMAGGVIGYTNFLLDIAPSKDRPTYISLNGTLTVPVMIFPLIGGILIQYISYKFLLIVTIIIVLIGSILSLWLREPREYTNGVKPKIDST